MPIFSTGTWTHDQWAAFAGFLVCGLAGLALITLAVRSVRRRRAEEAEVAHLIASWRATPSHTLALVAGPVAALAEVAEHLAPGAGSLTTLAAVGEGSLTRAAPPVDPEVARWFAEAFDRPAHVPGRTEAGELDEGGALTRFRVAVEAPMRKAHLWELQGAQHEHGGSAAHWAAVDSLRIALLGPSCELPLVHRPEYQRRIAEALLVAA